MAPQAKAKPIRLEDLAAAIEAIGHVKIGPKQVGSQSEADELTARDPAGHVWTVGEKYYEVKHHGC